MKIEMTVDWNALPDEPQPEPKPYTRYPKIPTSRADRRLWYIALSRHIDEMIDTGQTDSLADIARMCCVSRARISQLFDLALT